MQACAQLSVYVYWGWYWREVYDSAHLIAAQLAFAYAFDMLLTWSRRERYVLGFGPFPIIFSINLFMWFKPEWFALQFLMVAVGFAVKEFVRWNKDGRRAHIFNPSSFPLGLFALGLIPDRRHRHHLGAGNRGDADLPAAHLPADLPGERARAAPVRCRLDDALSAVATTWLFILAHYALTGSHFFSRRRRSAAARCR